MSSRSRWFGTVVLAVLVGMASLALAAKTSPRNGDFETGTLKGWHTAIGSEMGGQSWVAYKDGNQKVRNRSYERRGGIPSHFYDPPQGKFAAYAPGTGGPRFLFRNLHLRPGKKISLSMDVFYKNYAGKFFSPDTFDNGTDVKNQQYRIDVIKKSADLDSLAKSDILETVFRTKPGDKAKRKPFKVTTDLSKLAGKTVTLRLAEADNQFYFYPGVDAVKLKQKAKH
jgi:hypothetical protein